MSGPRTEDKGAARRGPPMYHERVRRRARVEGGAVVLYHLHRVVLYRLHLVVLYRLHLVVLYRLHLVVLAALS